MPALAERIAEQLQAPTSVDPADLDGLDDDTTAVVGKRPRFKDPSLKKAPSGPAEKRLRMRSGIPEISKYKGKKVDRKAAFGGAAADEDKAAAEEDDGGDDDDDSGAEDGAEPFPHPGLSDKEDDDEAGIAAEPGDLGDTSAGGFSISGELEAEYEKMMKQTSKQLEVMRTPSASDVTKKQEEAKRLKRQLDAWGALVEFRIHLEGALTLGHQLPVGDAAHASRDANASLAKEGDAIGQELRGLLGELLALQGQVADQSALRADIAEARSSQAEGEGESKAWGVIDGCMQRVLDWSLDAADSWKERTQLETRRNFKVLDQSLRMQMQAVTEVPPEKLRRRCTPPPGRHKVFGHATSAAAQGSNGGNGDGDAVQAEEPAGGEEEIFDDREFYVQLLREVLGGGGSGKPGGGLSEEAREMQLELQGRRATKRRARADVERRASKGRKIRYAPIEKLQNFMAPRPRASTTTGDSAGAELAVTAPMKEGAMEALLRSMFS